MKSQSTAPRLALSALALALGSATAVAQSRTYTDDADFDEGVLVNVNHDAPNQDQLQLGTESGEFPILSVACGGTGTVVRIDTRLGEVVGEYLSSPQGMERDPSRATVDLVGNTWVGNRLEDGAGGDVFGSVAQFGVVVGGTRVDAQGDPDPDGDYLLPPFEYSTAVDRDGDGLIRTSRGLGDVLDWPNLTDGAGGVDARVEDALDEAVLVFQRTTPERIRHICVDGQNDLWAGGYPTFPTSFDRIDGETGEVLENVSAVPPGCGGYAGLVDAAGVLWSTSELEGQVIRYDGQGPAVCIDVQANVRGIALAANGEVWTAGGNRLARISPDGKSVQIIKVRSATQLHGMAIHPDDGSLWVTSSGTDQVRRLDANGDHLAVIATDHQPRSVAVDVDGYVWVANQGADNVQRIDPATNQVDMTIDLRPGAAPYNPSDMTGVVATTTLLPTGSWQVTSDGGAAGVAWSEVSWNDSVPEGGALEVLARAADSEAQLPSEPWTPTQSGAGLALVGRYLEVRVEFTRSELSGLSPVLFDLSVEGEAPVEPEDCPPVNRREAGSLLVYPEFDNVTGSFTVLTLTNTDIGQHGNLYVEFVYIDGDSCEEYNRVETLTPNDTLTLITRFHNPEQERGFVYAFAKSSPGGSPIVANTLTGSVLVMNGSQESGLAVEYAINALAFEGIGQGGFTDVDGDGLRDLDGVEYEQAPDKILIPRFFGQGPGVAFGPQFFESQLILVSLSGGARFTTSLDFLVYNDNEEVFSTEHSFYCWDKVDLLDISNLFSTHFLLTGTYHDPDEVFGVGDLEAGWMRLDGGVATSSATAIEDPAFYAVLVERLGDKGAADLPFELCPQPGVLLPRDLYGGH